MRVSCDIVKMRHTLFFARGFLRCGPINEVVGLDLLATNKGDDCIAVFLLPHEMNTIILIITADR
jgi:hypothetical protein